jgi:hypothetical protein
VGKKRPYFTTCSIPECLEQLRKTTVNVNRNTMGRYLNPGSPENEMLRSDESRSVFTNHSINCVRHATILRWTFQNWGACRVCPFIMTTPMTNGDIWLQSSSPDYPAESLWQFFSQQQQKKILHFMTCNETLKRKVWLSVPHTFKKSQWHCNLNIPYRLHSGRSEQQQITTYTVILQIYSY